MNNNILPNKNNIININSIKKKGNIKLKTNGGLYQLSFYKTQTDFYDNKTYLSFIRAVEKLVRNSQEYKAYINYLKTEIGLDHCMIMSKITDEKATIEMHHGPIFTLFDIVSIVTEHMLKNNERVTTFSVAKIVLQEHFDNHIQIVMLSKTNHELVHANKLYIHPNQAWGDINAFIEKYKDGMTADQIKTYNDIVEIAEKNNSSSDNGNLKIKEIKSWNKGNPEVSLEDKEEELEYIELEDDEEE